MDLEGKRIKHNILKKEGTIIKCSEKYITVKLDNDLHEMQFQYPNCFLKYLSILDNQVSIEIKKAQKAREKKDKEEAEKTEQLKRKRDKYYTLKTDVHKPKTKTDYLQQYSSVNDFCESFEKEIDLEIQELRNTGAKRYQGYNIVKIDFNDSNYIYSFETDIEHFLPNGTQIKIHYYGKSQPATIISCEEYSIIISTNTFLAANIDMIEFSAEPWFLLLSLNERLDDLMNSPSLIAKDLISYASKEISPKEKILKGQNEACELSTKQPITFIWGPPGTGKTHTLARIVLNNLIQNNKVLMLSHSNVSVDGAMLRVYKLAPEIEPGKIIRYGYPRQAELLDHPYLTSFKYALYKKPHLQNKRDKLYAEKKKLKDVIKEQRKLLQPFLDRPDWIELDAEQKKLLKMYEKLSNTLSLIKKQDQIINSLGPKKTQEMLEDESTILKAFFAAKEYVEKEIHDQEALTADINEKVLKNTITEVRSELKLLQNQYIELRELIKKEQRQIQLSNASKDEDLRKILEKRLEEENRFKNDIDEKQRLLDYLENPISLHMNQIKIANIEMCISKIRSELLDAEKDAVKAAQFVATTVSKAVIDEIIYNRKFDVVIFDEASMAYIPQIVFSANLASKHFICLGDFYQLPPIVQNKSSRLLNVDIFQYCKINYAVENDYMHNWLCLLDTQYRMHPDIASFISSNMYHSLLSSSNEVLKEVERITFSEPFPGQALGIADLSGMMSVCLKTTDLSRFNVLSAFITCNLAIKAAKDNEVGIITPYNAQARLIRAMIRDITEQNEDLKQITCATVHQFQGSEKEVIIYDAVDCYIMPYPGTMLNSTKNNYANRLFNVAVTRAKGKFIAVVNRDYMKKKLSNNLLFNKLLCLKQIKSIYGEQLYDNNTNSSSSFRFISANNTDTLFLKDLAGAKNEILIDIPGQIESNDGFNKKFSRIINAKASSNSVRVLIRTEKRGDLPCELKKVTLENRFISNPITIIDKEIVWFGFPKSDYHFISEGNDIATQYQLIIRFCGKNTARVLCGFL